MEIEVELTNGDYVAFQMFHVKHSSALRSSRIRDDRIDRHPPHPRQSAADYSVRSNTTPSRSMRANIARYSAVPSSSQYSVVTGET